MTTWRHINTAPKGECPDGEDHQGPTVLLYMPLPNGGHRVTCGQWVQVVSTTPEYGVGGGPYLGRSEQDYWEGWMSWDGGFDSAQSPTHWMPMPEPPVGYFPPKNC